MKNRLTGLAFAAALLAGACTGKPVEEKPDDTDRLFHETLNLVKIYSDSIKGAPDSTLNGIYLRFMTRLDSLNFAVEADTDLQLTEGENDTIYSKLMELDSIYRARLSQRRDTLPENQPEDNPETSAEN